MYCFVTVGPVFLMSTVFSCLVYSDIVMYAEVQKNNFPQNWFLYESTNLQMVLERLFELMYEVTGRYLDSVLFIYLFRSRCELYQKCIAVFLNVMQAVNVASCFSFFLNPFHFLPSHCHFLSRYRCQHLLAAVPVV